MIWNWQKSDWPQFRYDTKAIQDFENQFLFQSGSILGVFKHLQKPEQAKLTIELISSEAMKTSEIEGELLNRESVQSSVRRQFGLSTISEKAGLAEQGIAEMMVDLFQRFDQKMSHEMLFKWHRQLMKGHPEVHNIGTYRTFKEPMQVVSGYTHKRKIHFEAPPSKEITKEMNQFIHWYNKCTLPALTKSGIAHLYFVSIHPFEDGNGRIARAISEKVLAESLKQPSLIGLSAAIQRERKKYYEALESANKSNETTEWLIYFSKTILTAQALTKTTIEFVLSKTRFFNKYSIELNERQKKVMLKLFKFGPNGFKGGLSADKYISIAKTSRATATRDLNDLVTMGAVTKTGELKHTRYWLNTPAG